MFIIESSKFNFGIHYLIMVMNEWSDKNIIDWSYINKQL